ncbi:MAG TPA: hypothetical protein VJ123_00725, partial [Anaerolineales bacterium]|nr:hypothetical protein [Anaerolineales bacterium]
MQVGRITLGHSAHGEGSCRPSESHALYLYLAARTASSSAVNVSATSCSLWLYERCQASRKSGEGQQSATLTLAARARLSLSPAAPVLGVVRGESASLSLTLRNAGAAPLRGLSISTPSALPWVYAVAPSTLPTLAPGESLAFSLFASPAADQSGDVFQGYVTVRAEGGLSAQAALTVELASAAARDARISVVDGEGQAVTGGGEVTLVEQKLTSVRLPSGEEKTFNRHFTQSLDAAGGALFAGLEPGGYNVLTAAHGYTRASGLLDLQPGLGTQSASVQVQLDPFDYTWTVVPIDQGYEITLTMTYDVRSPAPALLVPDACWGPPPSSGSILIYNPSLIAVSLRNLVVSLPGASLQVGSIPAALGPGQDVAIPVNVGSAGTGAKGTVEVFYAWSAAPERFVTFTFNPSSTTSPLLPPEETYRRDFVIEPTVFSAGVLYTLEIGQPQELPWISLSADPAGPMTWTEETEITVHMAASTPTFLAEGVYHDVAPIRVTGSDGTERSGMLDIEATKTAAGLLIHTSYQLGPVPTVEKTGVARGDIRSGECTPWAWTPFPAEHELSGRVSDDSVSFPEQGGGPVYGFDHQQVRLQLSQKVMLEGEGFEAHLALKNTSGAPLELVSVDILLSDLNGIDYSSGFTLIPQTPTELGTVPVGGSAAQDWLILPSNLGITAPEGVPFQASAAITYTWGGASYTVKTAPERITVYPAPDLAITYALPLPETVCDTFELTTIIANRGRGAARRLRFSSAQPQVVDNVSGIPIAFSIVETLVNGVSQGSTLDLDLGD